MSALDLDELWFTCADARLYATASGAGRPLVLLHGGLATHAAARRLAGPLAGLGRVITPDLRGSGRSIHRGPLTWARLADDVAALLDAVGADRAVIGGTSFGAGVAVAAALRHPDRVAALLVLHPAYGGAALGLTAAQRAAMAAMADAGARTLTDGVAALHPLFDALPEELRARARALVATYDPGSVAASTAFMASEAQPFDDGAALAAIAAPALVVPGVDPQHPREVADVYLRHLPRATTDEADLDHLGHAIARFVAALP